MLKNRGGFALPTVLIASVVMLAVLVTSISAVAATRTALQSQFFAQLARTAAESGLNMAESCIKSGTTTWSNPLRPGGTCAGLAAPCSTSDCYLVTNEGYRTSFTVSAPTVAGDASTVQATGILEQVRTTTGGVVRTYTQPLRQKDVKDYRKLTWKQVSVGTTHACGIAADDFVYCWGNNTYGQLGDGTTSNRSYPAPIARGAIPANLNIRQVVVSITGAVSCAIGANERAYCWGENYDGALGDGTTINRSSPVAVAQGALPSGGMVSQISASGTYVCAIATANTQAYCWGNNSTGQLGDGTTTSRSAPTAVVQGAMPASLIMRSISTSSGFSCAIASDMRAYCWGANAYGQLGDGTTTGRLSPTAVVQGATPANRIIRQINTGVTHTCAIASDNKAYCWGANNLNQLGDGTATNRLSPTAISPGALPGGSAAMVNQIAAGGSQTCVIANDNKPYCWGENSSGSIGDGSSTNRPTAVVVSQGAMESDKSTLLISLGQMSSCAISTKMKLYCWGANSNGQIGDGGTGDRLSPVAVSEIRSMSVGTSAPTPQLLSVSGGFSCVVGSDNVPYCWGANNYRQLSDGTTTNRSNPVAVSQGAIPAGSAILQLATGLNHACALASNSKVYCWGENAYGALGDGTTTNRSSPVAVIQGALPSGATVRQIYAGDYHTCVVTSDTNTYCWGGSTNGQLGDNVSTNTYRTTPAAVVQGALPSTIGIVQVSAGNTQSCVIAIDNRAYCWGENTYGNLGNGTTANTQPSPVAVSQGSLPSTRTVRQISVTLGACVIASDNDEYCWGNNVNGRIGDGTTTDRWVPTKVTQGAIPSGLVSSQIATAFHTCLLGLNKVVYCWGTNGSGELGDGTTTARLSPVTILSLPAFPPLTTTTYYY